MRLSYQKEDFSAGMKCNVATKGRERGGGREGEGERGRERGEGGRRGKEVRGCN